ncbi:MULTISPECIES: plasmid pRiA4b ORF-3 family protein [Sphingomonadaceae]|nr:MULTISPECIES: plasmid pRiA4b ORF-3 family protein [Sphingomonadaceae]
MSNSTIVRMKITLDDVTPAVSRTLEVPLNIRLDRLHTVIQTAFSWTDSHLWEMSFGQTGFGIPDPEYGFDGPLDARKATLAQVLADTRRKTFRYLYDFGDAWEHSVKIERVSAASPHLTYPLILDAVGMRPPEDSGGPWGYAEKLEALGDPQHEYHEEALETLGDNHDPNAKPDIPLIEARLETLAKKWAPRTRRKA